MLDSWQLERPETTKGKRTRGRTRLGSRYGLRRAYPVPRIRQGKRQASRRTRTRGAERRAAGSARTRAQSSWRGRRSGRSPQWMDDPIRGEGEGLAGAPGFHQNRSFRLTRTPTLESQGEENNKFLPNPSNSLKNHEFSHQEWRRNRERETGGRKSPPTYRAGVAARSGHDSQQHPPMAMALLPAESRNSPSAAASTNPGRKGRRAAAREHPTPNGRRGGRGGETDCLGIEDGGGLWWCGVGSRTVRRGAACVWADGLRWKEGSIQICPPRGSRAI